MVSAGRVKAGPDGESVELGPGDYMAYRGDVPHLYESLEAGTEFVLITRHVREKFAGNSNPAPTGKGRSPVA
ncbi:quercetin dioxygenase-like cupin family protein [Streptomyces albaduncus]|uniref:Quercetin dioxygenase-like cupin family protein n=1 Tax=Streptomyces griseoloalbus TaxID=67303 RepID=A0A7W8BL89_9ACTN|nr:quercetin dioxygenase-like cupin family protein [Streptomyces albaduncus]GGW31591.1 hypothetical protein GCM10010340_06380 [Streptomyces albaduncus]